MPCRPTGLLLTVLVGSAVLAACREEPAWRAAGWRPAAPPQRIVAASVFATEVLLAITPRERIAGVHRFAADPEYSLVVTEAAGLTLLGAEPEQLLAARPDLVVCDPFTRPETVALLGGAGVPVVTTANAASFDDVAANVRQVGSLCHLEGPAAALAAAMQKRLAEIAAKRQEVAGWRVMCIDGALNTHGRPSLFDALVTAAGASNLAGERGVSSYRRLDVETLLAWRPDALVVAEDEDGTGAAPAWLQQYPGVELLPCVRGNRIVRIPARLLGTTSHHLVEAAARLQQQLRKWGRP
ncbi:MAG: ABC transporter substrate-binding protein [Planctomycetota bacterium]